ncbi:hypothetical protein [Mariniblastus fucicola]|uniref:hypothetical protein n=1 Tax=Mariniblastus fucicola TaxID=980251 RepID=UPI0011DEFFFB|nr:hypothetical protein [Mariniblastus fucicola]
MARLYIIDQSLCKPGGHHFDYVNCVARAAHLDSHETIVATNRRFVSRRQTKNDAELPLHTIAKVVPSFRNSTYQKVSWLAGLRHLKRATSIEDLSVEEHASRLFSMQRFLRRRRTKLFRKQRRKVIAQFACDCSRFFGAAVPEKFERGDQIFFTTVSELELMGLAIYLASNPSSRLATWHLQFHFNLFDGRTPEFESQSAVQRKVRGCFLAALSRIPDHNLMFYCTSEELVEQYSRLNVADFWRLPYPVNQRFSPEGNRIETRTVDAAKIPAKAFATSSNAAGLTHDPENVDSFETSERATTSSVLPRITSHSGTARMVVPGELRREKGSAVHLQGVIDGLWDEYLSTGRLQVAVQRPNRKMLGRQKLELTLPEGSHGVTDAPVIDYLRHPLSEEQYCRFIRGADFGLLLHDSRAYYSRRAGVLGELLSCGKPVIVPAGCWLAHQLQEPQFRHVDRMMRQLPSGRKVELREMSFDSDNAPLSGGIVSFDRQRHPFRADCAKSPDENIVIVSFDWQHPQSRGVDARIHCTESTADGSQQTSTQVVGHRFSAGKCHVMFRVDFGGNKIGLEIENAFDDSTASIRNLSMDLFQADNPRQVPLGAIGMIYADRDSIQDCVAELVEHLDHYQFSAQDYSQRWWNAHDPKRTLDYLVGSGNANLSVA